MRTLATLLLAFLLAPAFAQTPCDGADHTILAGNFYYNPATLTINAGETVAWVNEGGFHDVNGNVSVISGESFGNPEVFSLPSISGDANGVCMGTHTFTVPGTYNYDCSIGSHAANGMVASITVVASSSGCNDPLVQLRRRWHRHRRPQLLRHRTLHPRGKRLHRPHRLRRLRQWISGRLFFAGSARTGPRWWSSVLHPVRRCGGLSGGIRI